MHSVYKDVKGEHSVSVREDKREGEMKGVTMLSPSTASLCDVLSNPVFTHFY